MKKLLLLFLGFALVQNLNAQHYSANTFFVGPSISGGFANNNIKKWDEGINNAGPYYSVGAFIGYCLTDVIGVQIEGFYSNGIDNITASESIRIPATLNFQFASHQHLGVGLLYRHAFKDFTKLDGGMLNYQFERLNVNKLYAIVEFSTLTNYLKLIGLNNFAVTDELTKTRFFMRGGYAIIPSTFTLVPQTEILISEQPVGEVKFNPFFFEMGIRYDLISLFSDNSPKKSKSKTRRRR
ncbi:MAG: hypothetical protein PHY55_00635 [Bacteroidales bacterium]|nr:hypothetical protein [Bacteroidales bacterium]